MRALVQYASKLDTHTEGALRIIEYFDALVEHGATLEACVRAAAGLSQCTAGLRDLAGSWEIRFDRHGLPAGGQPAPSTMQTVRSNDDDVGEVWLERSAQVSALDQIAVERMALAAGILWRSSIRPTRNTASFVEISLAAATAPEERSTALKLLGLDPKSPTSVIALTGVETGELRKQVKLFETTVLAGPSEHGRHAGRGCSAVLGNVGATLLQPVVPLDLLRRTGAPLGARIGVGRADDSEGLAVAWEGAQIATRFCGVLGFDSVVDHAELGALAPLAAVPESLVFNNPDVRAIARLSETGRGIGSLEVLERRLASGSLRQAAASLHLHHSSVSYQLKQAERTLGLSLDDPRHRLRAQVALALWKVSRR